MECYRLVISVLIQASSLGARRESSRRYEWYSPFGRAKAMRRALKEIKSVRLPRNLLANNWLAMTDGIMAMASRREATKGRLLALQSSLQILREGDRSRWNQLASACTYSRRVHRWLANLRWVFGRPWIPFPACQCN